jgi:UrcA family protein
MRTLTASIQAEILRKGLLAMLVCGALAVLSPGARAADPEDIAQITISSPVVKVVGRHRDLSPKEEVSVTARVAFDPVTLTTNSGVALLKDRVVETAHSVCAAADPQDVEDDEDCVQRAIRGTDKQIDAAVASAKKVSAGS